MKTVHERGTDILIRLCYSLRVKSKLKDILAISPTAPSPVHMQRPLEEPWSWSSVCTNPNPRKNLAERTIDRYWGESSPYDILTADNLKYLVLNQSIADLTHFAQNIDFEFANSTNSSHPSTVVCSPNPISKM
jgi:hypothetical protein